MSRTPQALPSFISRQVTDARRFYFESAKGVRGPKVVCGGWERTERDYRIARSGFRYLGLEFVAGGRGMLRLAGRSYPLSRGIVFAYGPGVAHEITSDSTDPLSKYFVDLSGASAKAAMKVSGIAPGTCHAVASADEVQASFEHLLAGGRRGTPAAAKIAALQAQILLLLLTEERLPAGNRAAGSRTTFLRCRDFLEKNFATIRTAEQASAACGVAPAYLSRLFRRFTGQPAYRFLMRLRMNHAAALMERGALNVSETADAMGMDPFHFSRAFKRVHGRPPIFFLSQPEHSDPDD